jgi:hypothetical protein
MLLKKFIIFPLIATFAILVSDKSYSQIIRETTFDNRAFCEESKGVWRQFGSGCADTCESKFDIYFICNKQIIFSCDCGNNNCFDDNRCIALSDYKTKFDKKKAESDKKIAIAKKEREERIKNDQNIAVYLNKLYHPTQAGVSVEQPTNSANNIGDKTKLIDDTNQNNRSMSPIEIMAEAAKAPEVKAPAGYIMQNNTQNQITNSQPSLTNRATSDLQTNVNNGEKQSDALPVKLPEISIP